MMSFQRFTFAKIQNYLITTKKNVDIPKDIRHMAIIFPEG